MASSGGDCVLRMVVQRNLREEAIVQGILVLKEIVYELALPIFQGKKES